MTVKEKMPSITIRNLEPEIHRFIKQEGASHGRSMEEEARYILRLYKKTHTASPEQMARRIHQIFKEVGGGDDIVLPKREKVPDPISFEE